MSVFSVDFFFSPATLNAFVAWVAFLVYIVECPSFSLNIFACCFLYIISSASFIV